MSTEKECKHLVAFEDIPYDRISVERILTGFPDLDYFNKGIETGLTEVLGDTNVGKSIFTSMLIQSAIKQHYKVGVFAGEHSLRGYKELVMQQNGRKGEFVAVPYVDANGHSTNIVDWYVNETAEKRIREIYDGNLFMYDVRRNERDIDTIIDTILYAYKKYGVRFWILDNLMEIENRAANQWQEQTDIGTKLRNVFVQRKLFGVLVMHIHKTRGLRLSIKDAFGSSNITNKAYRVWVLYRKDTLYPTKEQEKELEYIKQDLAKNGFDYEKCDGFIDTVKAKGNGNGIIGITYDAETKTYKQAEKVSKTEADKIYKKAERRQQTLTDLIPVVDDGQLPF